MFECVRDEFSLLFVVVDYVALRKYECIRVLIH